MRNLTIMAVALGIANALPAHAQEFIKPGTVLELGQTAVVPYKVPKGPQVAVELKVTAIEEGTAADLEGFNLPANLKEARPIFVRYEYTNLSDEDIKGPRLSFVAVDDRDQAHLPASTLGGSGTKLFNSCRSSGLRSQVRGVSHQGCVFFVLHKDGHIKAAAYKGSWSGSKRQEPGKDIVQDVFYDPIRWVAGKPAGQEKPAQRQVVVP